MGHVAALFTTSLPVALATTALRFCVNSVFCGARLGQKTTKSARSALVEESWLLASSAVLLALSTWAVQQHNARCTLFDQTGCFDDWPHTYNSPIAARALAAFLGWYVHGLLKSFVPGVGLRSGRDMLGHHVLTLGLFSVAHLFHTQRMALLILAIFNFSNPFMHVAKVLHGANAAKPAKAGAFMLFAAAFAVSRCVSYPLLLRVMLQEVAKHVRAGDRRPIIPAAFSFAGLFALLLLQFYWLARIVRVIKNGGLEHAHNKKVPQAAAAPDADGSRPQERTGQHEGGPDSPHHASDVSSCTTDPLGGTGSEEGGLQGDSKLAESSTLRRRPYYDSARGDTHAAGQAQPAD